MTVRALTAAEIAERIAYTKGVRIARLLPKAMDLLRQHAGEPDEGQVWEVTGPQLAAIIDEVQQDLRRQHAEDLKEAERDARDAYSQGRYEGEESARHDY